MMTKYGPLLSLTQLAALFDRSADGVRLSLLADNDFSRRIRPTKIKLGRRIYFKTELVAKVISGEIVEASKV
ncbi:MAG TPA: DNA-binding protein [Sulfuricella sp.]|nr:DNA-binding protein [Sulfuricella sp.]